VCARACVCEWVSHLTRAITHTTKEQFLHFPLAPVNCNKWLMILWSDTLKWYSELILWIDTLNWYSEVIVWIDTLKWYSEVILWSDTLKWYSEVILW
jgi:hypothetical protein